MGGNSALQLLLWLCPWIDDQLELLNSIVILFTKKRHITHKVGVEVTHRGSQGIEFDAHLWLFFFL